MILFHVHAENEQGKTRAPRTWFVIAGSLIDAVSLIPDGLSVKAIEVRVGTVAGPGRVIGSLAESTVH